MPGRKYKIGFTDKSLGDIEDLPRADYERILNGCLRLETNPVPDGKHIRKLKGFKDLYRLRVGEYRVIFEWRSDTVTAIRVLTRQDFGKKY